MGEGVYFEEVGEAGLGEVDVGVGGIFGLGVGWLVVCVIGTGVGPHHCETCGCGSKIRNNVRYQRVCGMQVVR